MTIVIAAHSRARAELVQVPHFKINIFLLLLIFAILARHRSVRGPNEILTYHLLWKIFSKLTGASFCHLHFGPRIRFWLSTAATFHTPAKVNLTLVYEYLQCGQPLLTTPPTAFWKYWFLVSARYFRSGTLNLRQFFTFFGNDLVHIISTNNLIPKYPK